MSPLAAIAKSIRAQIKSGELAPGCQLPSFAEIAENGATSIGTVQRVMDTLRAEGLIVTRKGSGSFVAEIQQGYRDDDPDLRAHLGEAS